ncbi:MAG: GMC oxidoreductase [Microthrixaceae bacterium]|nr:GMC oxidoreductase [Microthrixaceae bacterium]
MSGVDVCVVGSGFGAGPAALRSVEAGRSVVVVEEGHRWDGRADSRKFLQRQGDIGYYLDLFRANVGFDFDRNAASIVLGGRGLGGGSLVYSMVSLRAPGFVFDDPVWPAEVDRAELDPYYLRAEQQLGVVQLQWSGARPTDDWRINAKRDAAFAVMCERAGVSCDPTPVAISARCGNLGWCTTGCIRHAKNSVDMRYLQPAEDLGAEMRVGTRVEWVEPAGALDGRRWRVHTTGMSDGVAGEVLCDTVVLAAGAVGSAALLQRSAAHLPGGVSRQVGRNLSRGGDILIPAVLPEDLELDDLEMAPGKIIGSCSFQYLFEPPPGFGDDWQRFIIQPMMVLPVVSSVLVADPDGITEDGGDMRMFGLGHKHLMQKWGTRLLHLGVMGIDGMDGTVSANRTGGVSIEYTTSPRTEALQSAARAGVRHIIETSGGRVLPSWDELRNDTLSIHPLGTCRMAAGPDQGAVDHRCRVFKSSGGVHDGLYVTDTSTYSSPIAVNTSLTAAAISERAMALMD